MPATNRTTSAATDRRRRHVHYHADFPVVVVMLRGDGYRRLEAHSKDLTAAGIGMLVADEPSLGEVAALEFSLLGAPERWELRAVLRHSGGYGIARAVNWRTDQRQVTSVT